MTVYKSKVTFYGILFSLGFLSLVLWFLLNKLFIEALGCFLWTLVPIGFTWLSYKWRFVTADDYMHIDSIIFGKRIEWHAVIAIEDMKYENGTYLLRLVSKSKLFEVPVSMLNKQDINEIVNYLKGKSIYHNIPFNRDTPYLKSIYYQYNPKMIAKLGWFWPPLLPKIRGWIYAIFVGFALGFSMLIKFFKPSSTSDLEYQQIWIYVIMFMLFEWVNLLFAQFPQNLRAIEHNQREQHEQMFVPTVASAQPYRLPFVLVSGGVVLLIAGFAWYLTR
jgi:hypothetical protein